MPATPKAVMRSLRRRIAALERAASFAHQDRERIASRALNGLWPPAAERLLSALGASRQGRPLNSDEAAAKQAYQEALTRECHWAGCASSEGFEDALSLRDLMVVALAQSVSGAELELSRRAMMAHLQGQDATPEESAALQTCTNEWTRLSRLAGMDLAAGTAQREDGAR